MKKNLFIYLCLFPGLLLLQACGEASSDSKDQAVVEPAAADSTQSEPSIPTVPTGELKPQEIVFSWVDNLNLREKPNTSSKVIAKITDNHPLTFSGEKTDFSEKITLRGVSYDDPWIKVTTADQKTGWVFQGAVKRKGEEKGTPLTNETTIDFPHFGRYDLATWKKEKTKDESGGDAEIETQIYRKGNQILEITVSDVGEYGYGRSYTLMDQDRNVLKKRSLDFTIDPNRLVEIVYDYSSQPGKQYTREQAFDVHYSRLNSKPEMARGEFKMTTISKPK